MCVDCWLRMHRCMKPLRSPPHLIKDIIRHVADDHGQQITKLPGLCMHNTTIFTLLPLASADSTNVARNIRIDSPWKGTYSPQSKETRASILLEELESINSTGSLEYWET